MNINQKGSQNEAEKYCPNSDSREYTRVKEVSKVNFDSKNQDWKNKKVENPDFKMVRDNVDQSYVNAQPKRGLKSAPRQSIRVATMYVEAVSKPLD